MSQHIRYKHISQNKTNVVWLMLLLIFTAINGIFVAETHVPALPDMVDIFAVSPSQTKFTITLYLIGLAFSQLVYGPLADRFGRRPVILIGIGISIVGSLICVFALSMPVLILGRVVQGIGLGAPISLCRTILSDLFTGRQLAKLGAYFSSAFSVAPAIAPLIGGYLYTWYGLQSIFVFVVIYGLLTFILIWYFLPETNLNLNSQATRWSVITNNYLYLLKDRIFLGYAISASMSLSGIIGYYTMSPFLLQDVLLLSPVEYAWVATMTVVAIILGRLLNVVLLKWMNIRQLVIIGNISMLLASTVLVGIGLLGYLNLIVVIVPVMFFLLGGGLVFSNAMAGALSPFRKIAGSAGALYGFFVTFGAFIISFIAAHLHSQNQVAMGYLFLLLGVVGCAAIFAVVKQERIAVRASIS